MRITINLATRPYVELTPVLRKLRITIISLAVVCLALGVWMYFLARKDHERQQRVDAVVHETTRFQQERAGNEARMRQPANAAELERSQFLNTLFARKAFSWTAVLMDLEEVLPTGLQVSNIEPQLAPNGDVQIRLRVAGERDRAVELVRNLEKSKRFLAPRLAGEAAQQTQNRNNALALPQGPGALPPGSVEFEILAAYNPLQTRMQSMREKPAAPAKVEVHP